MICCKIYRLPYKTRKTGLVLKASRKPQTGNTDFFFFCTTTSIYMRY